MVLTKENEKPFDFYVREQEREEEEENGNQVINPEWDVMGNPPFKANPVPWHCKVQKFKRMTENDKADREQRVKQNAEKSYSMAKLPPRMQAY